MVDNAQLSIMPKHYPPPTPVFVGYECILEKIQTCLVDNEGGRVFVLYGLGGMGKTQITSRFIEMNSDYWQEVIYLDASSPEAIISSLQAYFRSKGMNVAEHKDFSEMRWSHYKYLIVFDGADDPSLCIDKFFPPEWSACYWNILITSRNRDLTLLARGPNSDHHITGMSLDESRELLLKTARMKDEELSIEDNEATSALVKVC